jgi:hypothetical protein
MEDLKAHVNDHSVPGALECQLFRLALMQSVIMAFIAPIAGGPLNATVFLPDFWFFSVFFRSE